MTAAANGASALAINVDAIPQELKDRPQWVLWRREMRRGKPTKVPYQTNGKPAKSNDPSTWGKFKGVWAIYQVHAHKYSGIGYVFSPDDPYCGIDLDLCLRPDGTLTDWAQQVFDLVPSYTEVSPSGLGLKVIARGKFALAAGETGATHTGFEPGASAPDKRAEIAVWNDRRYFTLTGEVYAGRASIEECQPGIDRLHAIHRQRRASAKTHAKRTAGEPCADGAVHAKALGAMLRATKSMEDGADGSRRLVTVACRAVEFGLSDQVAVATIRAYEVKRPFLTSWSDADILQRFQDAKGMTCAPASDGRMLTDVGNAERFAEQHGSSVRYIHLWDKWLVWNGKRWELDESGAVVRLAKQTAKSIYHEAAECEDLDEVEKIVRWAKQSQSAPRLEAMLKLARSERPIPIAHDALDADPWLLNCENGVIDLRTGALLPHDPSRLFTKTTRLEYPDEPGVDAPLWCEALDRIFVGNQQLIAFYQRLMGSSLVGAVYEHILAILWGSGANGKSVVTETTMEAMGDYAIKAPPGLLMAKRSESHPTELTDLFGRRLVVIAETGEGQRLDERLVKELTGGDTIRARRMREDFWQFKPTHLAVMVTNHKPAVRGTDHGIWRRLRLIPFTVTIPEAEQDKELVHKLRGELPAILRWLVTGCLAWQRDGLNPPEEVLLATEGYKVESDTFAQWWDENVVLDGRAECRASAAYQSYVSWCDRTGERSVNLRRFGDRVAACDISKRRSNGLIYEGMRVRSADDAEPSDQWNDSSS